MLPPADPTMFGVVKKEDLAWVRPRLVAQLIKTYTDPIKIANPGAAKIPHVYIYCQHPHSLLDQFIGKIRNDKDWQYIEITAGHDAMIVEAEQVARVLQELVKP